MSRITFKKLHIRGWRYPVSVHQMKSTLSKMDDAKHVWNPTIRFMDRKDVRISNSESDVQVIGNMNSSRKLSSCNSVYWFPAKSATAERVDALFEKGIWPKILGKGESLIEKSPEGFLWICFDPRNDRMSFHPRRGNQRFKAKTRDMGFRDPRR